MSLFIWNGRKLNSFADAQEAIKTVNDMSDVVALSNIIVSMNIYGVITSEEVFSAGSEMGLQILRIKDDKPEAT